MAIRWLDQAAREIVAAIGLFFILCGAPAYAQHSIVRDGWAALDNDDLARALELFEQARAQGVQDPQLARGLMLAYLRSRHPDRALTTGQEAVLQWPQNAEMA